MTRTAAKPTAAQPAALTACAACAAPFHARNDAQLYCSTDCRRLGARLSGLRDMADSILANGASATRGKAVYRMRRMLAAAVTAGTGPGPRLPAASEKADRHEDGPRAGQLRRRRWCSCCGSDLGEINGRGRPPVSCRRDSGRNCARFRNRAQEVADLADAICAGAPAPAAARRAILRTVTEINRDIGLA